MLINISIKLIISGVYFYKLQAQQKNVWQIRQTDVGQAHQKDAGQAGNFVSVKKLLLMK